MIDDDIEDLIALASRDDANMRLIIIDAYWRGMITGKDIAKQKMIEAIEKEK